MPDALQPPAPTSSTTLVLAALDEDGASRRRDDARARAAGPVGRGVFVAKDDGVIAGLPVAAAAMTALDEEVAFDTLVADGDRVSAGAAPRRGRRARCASILSAERVALNFLQRLSGIATLTREFVDAVVGHEGA